MIILTGGAGFVGSNLLRELNSRGAEDILIIDNIEGTQKHKNITGAKYRDYVNKSAFLLQLGKSIHGSEVDVIFHQGACTNTLETNEDYMLHNNFEYSKALLHFATDHRIPFIYASSAAVYGNRQIGIEDDGLESSLNIYGESKVLFDRYVRSLIPRIESTVVGLRYFNAYGIGESYKGKMSSMVHQLYDQVHKIGVAKIFGAYGEFGPGEQRRDFVSVKNLVDINLFFYEKDSIQEIVNAGTGVDRTWNELANVIIGEAGAGHIEYMEFPKEMEGKYQTNLRADTSKLRKLGYEQDFYTLEQGIHNFVMALRKDHS